MLPPFFFLGGDMGRRGRAYPAEDGDKERFCRPRRVGQHIVVRVTVLRTSCGSVVSPRRTPAA